MFSGVLTAVMPAPHSVVVAFRRRPYAVGVTRM
jgi:hypothetical protein